jgi:glycosyltransferase involved in cell wall biosynthesis
MLTRVQDDRAIAYVLDGFPGSSQSAVLDEILELGRSGLNVHVVVVEPDVVSMCSLLGMREDARGSRSSSYRLLTTTSPRAVGADDGDRPILHAQALWVAGQVVGKQIRHLHAEVGTADVAREVKRMTGIGYSFTAAASEMHPHRRHRGCLRDQVRDAEFVVALSNISRKQLLDATGPSLARNVHRIYRGVDLDQFRFQPDATRDQNAVLAVTPLSSGSGLADLIEAAALLRDRRATPVRVTIVGEGELEDDLRARIASLHLENTVTILPPAGGVRLRALMRGHAVMALPYGVPPGGGRDGVPPVLLQAMAVGLPVLSTFVRGIPEVLDDGWTGRLVTPQDPAWLAGALETMLDNLPLRIRMAAEARDLVERQFALSRNVSHLARLFSTAVTARTIAN